MTEETSVVETGGDDQIPATSYVSKQQYQEWKEVADEKNQSISSFIATHVEAGRREIEQVADQPSDIVELRKQVQELRAERDNLRNKLNNIENMQYGVGMGRVKDLIINNPGIDKASIVNFVMEEPVKVTDDILSNLRKTDFVNKEGKWYPPEEMEVEE